MRALYAIVVAALLFACVSGDTSTPQCTGDQQLVCRAANDCRCASPCTPGSACMLATGGTPICAEITDSPSMGVCVDVSWLTGAPAGMVRCGSNTCPSTSSCVDWGAAGLQCAAPCRTNADCASSCCTSVADRNTSRSYNLCAPDTRFRCMGATAGSRCQPACTAGQTCVLNGTTPRCAATCATDDDCAASGTCCAELRGGGRACNVPRATCTAALTPACTVLDDCVTVTWAARGDHCGDSPDAVEVRVRNDCTRAADIEICFPRRDGTCTCGRHRNVAPGAEPSPSFWACDVLGRYAISARAAGDADGCHPGFCG